MVKELISALKPRGITRAAALHFIGLAAQECYDYALDKALEKDVTAAPEEQARLDTLESALRDMQLERRFLQVMDRKTQERVEELLSALERAKVFHPEPKTRGRPRTRGERLYHVRRSCLHWREATGQLPTCRPSDLEPGFHYVFKTLWDELAGEELTDEALTKDINDWQNSQ
ncbi:MAG: hypothetical protein LAT83_04275 [Kiritimatiellae bacterium]|nr:hypothetical protein [Kiritimatiellia bacterium]